MSPGITTGALVCVGLQYAFNELSMARVRYVSAWQAPSTPASSAPQTSPSVAPSNKEPPKSFWERTSAFVGLSKVSDEEYLTNLKRTRDRHLKRIEKLEQQLDEKTGGALDIDDEGK
jgi:hypothetical protein